ncbi:MAG TPA: alpha/beta hydrolase [Pseudomonas sp.]
MTLASLTDSQHAEAPLLEQLDATFPLRQLVFARARTDVRECGAGPTVVLLHGIGSGAASWLQVAQRLSGQARVVAWDAPGYGESTPLAVAQPRAEDYAQRLDQLLDGLGIQRCLLVGHSLGALTAMACAQGPAAKRIEHLMLISPALGYGAPQRRQRGLEVRATRRHNLEQYGTAGTAERRSHHLLSPRASAMAQAWVRWNMARLNPQGYLQAVELLCGDDLLRFGRPAMPCEVHCGEDDAITVPEECRQIAEHFGASFSLIPQAGHASPVEQPDAVAERITHALKTPLKEYVHD